MSTEIYQAIIDAIDAGAAFAVASVIESKGSSPGKPGHKMMLFADSRQIGTIGGGTLELKVKEEMLGMIASGQGGILNYSFDSDSLESSGMVCGGQATIAVEVTSPTVRLLFCGGGHVAFSTAAQCRQLGYAYSVVDAREGLVSDSRYPEAARIMIESPVDYVARADLANYSHILIFTHEHSLDLNILRTVHKTDFTGYIGLIGSKKKWALFQNSLLEEGVTREWLNAVHCPIGLEIHADTPAEIALSIAAEIVKERSR